MTTPESQRLATQASRKMLGRYELVEMLGQGGMGEVWLAKLSGAAGFEKACIVKTVLPALAKDPQFAQRFQHEAKVLVQLNHSNIAQVYDMAEADGGLFMALEYVPGVDLSRLVTQVQSENSMLPIPVALFVIQQAAEGLGYAHRRAGLDGQPLGIVHRDVSPHNVMVSYEGEVKVIDFGVARSAGRQLTQGPMVVGKLGYMAPEQAMAQPLDGRADQYALGLMLWELLSGQHYVPTGSVTEQMMAMAMPKWRPLLDAQPGVDAELEAVVKKALSTAPSDRYASTDEFARALSQQQGRFGGVPTRQQIGEYVRAKCSAAFTENQKLLSRLSTIGGSTLTQPIQLGTPTSPPTAPIPPAVPSVNTQEALQAMQPSRAPFIVVVSVVALAVVGGVAFFLKSRNVETPQPVAPVADVPKTPELAKPPEVAAPPPVTEVVAAEIPAAGGGDAGAVIQVGPLVEVKAVADTFLDRGDRFVRLGTDDGLAPGDELRLVGSPQGAGRPLLGRGTVVEAFGKLARMHLDDTAAAAPGAIFAEVPPKKAAGAKVADSGAKVVDAGTAKAKEPVKPATGGGKISARIKLQRTPVWSITVFNTSGFMWKSCTVYIPGKKSAPIRSVPNAFSKELPLQSFLDDGAAPVLTNDVMIKCPEGSITLPANE